MFQVTADWIVKVADFGTARQQLDLAEEEPSGHRNTVTSFMDVATGCSTSMQEDNSPQTAREVIMTTHVGTLLWQAPELIEKRPRYSATAVDVYSFAVVIAEVRREGCNKNDERRHLIDIFGATPVLMACTFCVAQILTHLIYSNSTVSNFNLRANFD